MKEYELFSVGSGEPWEDCELERTRHLAFEEDDWPRREGWTGVKETGLREISSQAITSVARVRDDEGVGQWMWDSEGQTGVCACGRDTDTTSSLISCPR